MTELTEQQRYDYIVAQIAREDDLYQKRISFLIILNTALAAGAASQFHYGARVLLAIPIAVFAILITFALNNGLHDGKRQLHYLRTQYYGSVKSTGFPRPFMSVGDTEGLSIPPRKYGRVVREFLIGWTSLLLCSLAAFLHYSLIGHLNA